MEPIQNYIGGKWCAPAPADFSTVVNPATAEVLTKVSTGGGADIAAAVEAASAAYPDWRRTPPEERIQFLFKLKQLLEANLDSASTQKTS